MSDDMGDIELGEDNASKLNQKRSGGASGLIKILVIIAAAIGAIIFVATVSVITVLIMDNSSAVTTLTSISEEYRGVPVYDYTEPMEIRGRTSDRAPRTFQISVALGFNPGDDKTSAEIARRNSQLQDLIRRFFSQKTADMLQPENETQLKTELKEQINRVFSQGVVKDILFTEYLIDF